MSDPRSVEIIGFSGDRKMAPLISDEVWGLNQLFRSFQDVPWTRWFEMHDLEFLRKWDPEYIDWLKTLEIPIMMQKHHDEIPTSVEFPRDEVNAVLGARFGFSFDYFTSSFSYMLAQAIFEGFEEIGLYGIAFLLDGEATYERPGLEYLIGIAQGAGIKVTLPPGSAMLRINYVYGYEEPRMRLSDVSAIMDFLEYSEQLARTNVNRIDVMMDDYPDLPKTEPLKKREERRKLIVELSTRLVENNANRKMLGDLKWWLKHYGRGGNLISPEGDLAKS